VLTYVVTASREQLLDYCEHARLHPDATRLVRTLWDLKGADLAVDRLVFWGDYRHLCALASIQRWAMTQVLQHGHTFENLEPAPRQRGLPLTGLEQLGERRHHRR
jgi:hypothetical protein